jgi:1-acyl-sn-glycerol-3-phosphate acyltransferase
MKLFLKRLYTYFYRFNVGIIYIFWWPLLYFFSRKPSRYKYLDKMRGWWGFLSSLCTGIVYRYEFEQPIDWSRTYIICPNHVSNLDISAISILAKNNYSFMGKDDLLDGFVTGLFFRTVDIPVNRESKMSSFRAYKKAAEWLENGITMVIFPEGTIPKNYPPELQKFKNGPFKLAIDHKVPIIPVTIFDTWKVMWDNGIQYGTRPGNCSIFVHKPIETSSLKAADAETLKDMVRNIITNKFDAEQLN